MHFLTWLEAAIVDFPGVNGKDFTALVFQVNGEHRQRRDGEWEGSLVEYFRCLARIGNFSYNIVTLEEIVDNDTTIEYQELIYSPEYYTKIDLILMTDTEHPDSNFFVLQPEVYHSEKPIFTVDQPILRGVEELDLGRIFRIFSPGIWTFLIAAVILFILLSATKAALDGSGFGVAVEQEFERVAGYVTTQVSLLLLSYRKPEPPITGRLRFSSRKRTVPESSHHNVRVSVRDYNRIVFKLAFSLHSC